MRNVIAHGGKTEKASNGWKYFRNLGGKACGLSEQLFSIIKLHKVELVVA